MKSLHFNLMRELNNPLLNESLTKGQNKKHTLEGDKQFYIQIRNRHPEAESSSWMQKNGYEALYTRIRRYKLTWHNFKASCGFNDLDRNKTYTLEEYRKLYIKIRNKNPEAESSSWMRSNGYSSFYRRVLKRHKLTWHDFKASCGFDDLDRNKTYTLEEDKQSYIDIRNKNPEAVKSSWIVDNGHMNLYARIRRVHKLSYHEFKKLCGFDDLDRIKRYTLEEDKKSYIELIKKYPQAKSSAWMQKNGHSVLYNRTSRIHKLTWKEFKVSCGFNDFNRNKDTL